MRINLHASGFDLANCTRDFVQSKLLYRLGEFRGRIGSVEVNLSTAKGRNRPDVAACEIVVNIHPSGEVRRRAEHEWLHVAIDQAASAVSAEVEREMRQARPTLASPPDIGDRLHDHALEPALDDDRISHQQREMLDRPESYLRPVRVPERWRPTPTAERDGPRGRRDASHGRWKAGQRRWSGSLSRIY